MAWTFLARSGATFLLEAAFGFCIAASHTRKAVIPSIIRDGTRSSTAQSKVALRDLKWALRGLIQFSAGPKGDIAGSRRTYRIPSRARRGRAAPRGQGRFSVFELGRVRRVCDGARRVARVECPWTLKLISRLLADLHHSRAARIRVAGGGARGDAPDAPYPGARPSMRPSVRGMVSDFVLGSYVPSSKPKTKSDTTHLPTTHLAALRETQHALSETAQRLRSAHDRLAVFDEIGPTPLRVALRFSRMAGPFRRFFSADEVLDKALPQWSLERSVSGQGGH